MTSGHSTAHPEAISLRIDDTLSGSTAPNRSVHPTGSHCASGTGDPRHSPHTRSAEGPGGGVLSGGGGGVLSSGGSNSTASGAYAVSAGKNSGAGSDSGCGRVNGPVMAVLKDGVGPGAHVNRDLVPGDSQMRDVEADDPALLSKQRKINVRSEIYPTSIVWTAICGITWICPVIGHIGVCDEKGNIYEFLGMGASCGQGLAFGPVIRYLRLDPMLAAKLRWNDALELGCRQSEGRVHKGCFDNCHTYVADILNNMEYKGIRIYNSVVLALWMFIYGRYTGVGTFLLHWLPSAILYLALYMMLK